MRAYPANAKKHSPAACSTPSALDVVANARREASAPPEVSDRDHDRASTASTTATMILVSHADFCTPTVLTAVSATTAATATAWAWAGQA